MTAAEYERGGKKRKGIELPAYCSKKGKKKTKKTAKRLFRNLQINGERWLQKLVITCEIWGINGAGM